MTHRWLPLVLHSFVFATAGPQNGLPSSPAATAKSSQSYTAASAPVIQSSQSDYDVIYYDLALSIDPDARSVSGSVTCTARIEVGGVERIALNFYDNMEVSSVGGDAISFVHEDNLLWLQLNDPAMTGQVVSAMINYSGQPEVVQGLGLEFSTYQGKPTVDSESVPYFSQTWWPCKDDPGDKADSMDIAITVPAALTVATNGRLQQVVDHGDGTHTFYSEVRYPIATYLFSLAIGDYTTLHETYTSTTGDTMPILHYVYPTDRDRALVDFENTAAWIRMFEDWFGPYPFIDEKFGFAEYSGTYAAVEHQTMVSYSRSLITGDHGNDPVAVHELSHQWFGDAVTTKDWGHTWLNEGFASYCEALFKEHTEGWDAYREYMLTELPALNFTQPIFRYDLTKPFEIFDAVVYYKGAWVLHMLRYVVGDDAFFQIMRQYFERYIFSNATTEDFQAVSEEVYGASLGWFFNQWIYEAGHPHYRLSWSASEQGAVVVNVDQIQEEYPIFKMPVELEIRTASDSESVPLMIDSPTAHYIIHPQISGEVAEVVLDPLDKVLRQVTVTKAPILVVDSFDVDDSAGNGNGRADPSETVSMTIRLKNLGVAAPAVRVAMSTTDPDIEILSDQAELGDIDHLETAENTGAPFSFSVSQFAWGHLAVFHLHLTDAAGFSVRDSILVPIGPPNTLLVDDDGGADYERYYESALRASRAYYGAWSVSAQGGPPEDLAGYQAVIWLTGNDRTSTLTPQEQALIAAYLDGGGRLFISGQDIGYDLIVDGTAADSEFYADYLGARFVSDDSPDSLTIGVVGDPIGGGLFVYFTGPYPSAGNQSSPSVIEAANTNAAPILNYIPSTLRPAAIRHKLPSGGRVVYLAFGFEGIAGPFEDSAQELMSRSLRWLTGTPSRVADFHTPSVPASHGLGAVFPNPAKFAGGNTNLSLPFRLSDDCHVELSIYNLLGQRVRTILNEARPAGRHRATWDGTTGTGTLAPPGTYFVRMRVGDAQFLQQLTILR